MRMRRWLSVASVTTLFLLGTASLRGEDWPSHRGAGNFGVWNETGILEKFPEEGLDSRVRWRTPIRAGYSGPAVADGRVFITDFMWTTRPKGIERALALDEKTGKILWTREWETTYAGVSYDRGPRSTPAVDGDRVYFQGSTGMMFCLDVKTGDVIWSKDFLNDYKGQRERWLANYGFVAAPLIDGDKVICKVGGDPNAKVIAFDKRTGKEIWRALPSDTGIAYASMIIIKMAGVRQLIVWHDGAVDSLDPDTGKVWWEYPWRPTQSTAVATPVLSGRLLFFSAYYQGALMLELDEDKPGAHALWQSKSESETVTDYIHALIMSPLIIGDYIYGLDSHGELRCLKARTGERIWETQAVTRERALHATGHFVRNGERFFINNDFGELIIGTLSPEGYKEISHTKLIAPTTPSSQRRTGGKINWTQPAYANKHIITRNDEEIFSVNLAADGRD